MACLPAYLYGQSLPYACTGSRAAYGVTGLPNSVFIWEIDGGTILSDYNDSVIVEWDMTRRDHQIQVTEVTEYGCSGFPETGTVLVRSIVDLDEEYQFCENDSVLIDAETDYITQLSYLWNDGNTSSMYYEKNEGIIRVSVTGLDGCYSYDSAMVIVNPLPLVDIGRDTSLCGGSTLEVDAGFFSQYLWSTNEIMNPITIGGTNELSDTLSVIVTDANGCKSSDTMILYICAPELYFADIPNTIIPNDPTEENRTWRIDHLDLFPGVVVEIFDRWGRLIYHVVDPDPGNVWDGVSLANKEMPMDSYYYIIELNYRKVKPLMGTISIIR